MTKVLRHARLEDTRTLKYNTLAYVRIFQKVEYAYDTFRALNSIRPDLSETYVYLTPAQLYRPMT